MKEQEQVDEELCYPHTAVFRESRAGSFQKSLL
jgi:hypothetical protein